MPIIEERQIGRHRYTATHQPPVADSDETTTEYQVSNGTRIHRTVTAVSACSMPPLPRLAEERTSPASN